MRLAQTIYHNLPPATRWGLLLMFCGYIIFLAFGFRAELVLGLSPAFALGRLWLWQFITYIFMHGGFWHLLINGFMVWTFGAMFEGFWGTRKFLVYCAITGISAGLCHAAAEPHSAMPVVGASGVVFGLLAAFALEFPEMPVYAWFVFPMKAVHMALLLGAAELAMCFNPQKSAAANLAHLGGMVAGYIYLRWHPAIAGKLALLRGPETVRRVKTEDSDIDRILDKISSRGEESLTENEKRRMERYSKWLKR
ncbi:MAG: rhomboid family intramembrane serine protease [Elusimicrobiales bacterium]